MDVAREEAKQALRDLLLELPYELGSAPETVLWPRNRIEVIKERNVRTVHKALWVLQNYFGLED